MANRPIDDFDPRNPNGAPHDEAPVHDEPEELIDDEADFGGSHAGSHGRRGTHEDDTLHDDADFVDDDMNDIVDDADPLADDGEFDHDEDDFHDDDTHGEEPDHDAPPPRTPGGFSIGSLIFYAIIAAVVLGGGYMAYRTFVTGGEPVSAGSVLAAGKNVVVPTDVNTPVPSPLPADNSEPVPTTTAGNTNWQSTLSEEPAPPTEQAQAQMQPITATPTTATGEAAAPLATTAENTQAMAGLNARLAEAERQLSLTTAQVTSLTTSLKASQERVAMLENKPVTTSAAVTAPPVDSAAATELAKVKNDNADLKKQIAQLNRSQQALENQLQTQRTVAPASKPADKPTALATSRPASPKATAKVMQTEEAETPRSPKTRPQATTGRSTWVLRAATPGMAWVSPQPGSAELKRVVVGDELAGIGQVTGIRQENGRWIVEGSQGTIR